MILKKVGASLTLSLVALISGTGLAYSDNPIFKESFSVTVEQMNRFKQRISREIPMLSSDTPETTPSDLDKSQLVSQTRQEAQADLVTTPISLTTLEAIAIHANELVLTLQGNEPTTRINVDSKAETITLTLQNTKLAFSVPINRQPQALDHKSLQVRQYSERAEVEITFHTKTEDWQVNARPGSLTISPTLPSTATQNSPAPVPLASISDQTLSQKESPLTEDSIPSISSSSVSSSSPELNPNNPEITSQGETVVNAQPASMDSVTTEITSLPSASEASSADSSNPPIAPELAPSASPLENSTKLDSLKEKSSVSDTVTDSASHSPQNESLLAQGNSIEESPEVVSPTSETNNTNPITNEESLPDELKPEEESKNLSLLTPVQRLPFMQPSAIQLAEGEFLLNASNRFFFDSGSTSGSDTANYPNFGFTWGITNDFQLSLETQLLDSGTPGRQGSYLAIRNGNSASVEFVLQAQQKLWEADDSNQFLSLIASLSIGDARFQFTPLPGVSGQAQTVGDTILTPSLQIPYTVVADNWQFTVIPSLTFFSSANAISLHQAPVDNPGSFGTTFGLTGGIAYTVNPRLILWTDAFFPLIGSNSIQRTSGQTAQAIIYNAGLRYMVNPRTGLDFFASNSYGSVGPLALTGDRDFMALGTRIVLMPDWFSSNRRYPNNFKTADDLPDPLPTYGFGFLDGGTVPNGQLLFNLSGGSQGVMTAVRYGVFRDVELGIYLNYISGIVDESEQGLSGKVRLFNQSQGDPITASIGVTVSQTNQPFVNFFNNNRNQFIEDGLSKGLPWITSTDSEETGRLFIVTGSLPIQYQFEDQSALWFTPVLGYVQRSGGIQIAGFNLGGAWQFSSEFSLIGEIGANFINPGNGFSGNTLTNLIPWTFGLRWDLANLLNLNSSPNNTHPSVNLYITNRVGLSPWQQLRVRDQNEIGVGIGVSIPIELMNVF